MGTMNHSYPTPQNGEQPTSNTTQPEEEQVEAKQKKMLPWQIECLKDLRDTTISYSDLSIKYGRDKSTIDKLRKQHDVDRPMRAKSGPKPAVDRRPLSEEHRALGCRMTIYRGGNTYSDVGVALGLSRAVIRNIELGIHDVTLVQLLRIRELLKLPIEEMLKPYQIPTMVKTKR